MTRRWLYLSLLAVLTLAAAPKDADAYSYTVCLRWPVSLDDAGFGEDHGQSPTDPWRARGGRARIQRNGITYFDNYLDGAGCTSFVSAYSTGYDIYGWTSARVDGNDIEVRNSGDNIEFLSIADVDFGASGTKYYVYPETPRTTILAVAAFALQRFNGGLSGETFVYNDRCKPDGSECCNCSSGGEIWLNSTGRQRKFIMAHEYGHRLLAFWTGGYTNDCGFSVGAESACYTSSSHGLWSKEYTSCAAMEGWAHFVATDVFNEDDEGENPNATFKYWSYAPGGLTVNVENGPTGGDDKYLESTCTGTFGGRGVELDWLRHWWDYHTNGLASSPGFRPSHARMMNEMETALPWSSTDTHTKIRDAVETYSDATQQSRWDTYSSANGTDH